MFPDSLALLAIGQSLHAISFGLYHSTSSQLINSQFKGAFQIRGQALYSSITFGIGGSIGTLGSGFLWSYYGGAQVFMLCAVVMGIATVLGVIFSVFLRR
jgi:PPP family 3-phenylpropionic acid transporter